MKFFKNPILILIVISLLLLSGCSNKTQEELCKGDGLWVRVRGAAKYVDFFTFHTDGTFEGIGGWGSNADDTFTFEGTYKILKDDVKMEITDCSIDISDVEGWLVGTSFKWSHRMYDGEFCLYDTLGDKVYRSSELDN